MHDDNSTNGSHSYSVAKGSNGRNSDGKRNTESKTKRHLFVGQNEGGKRDALSPGYERGKEAEEEEEEEYDTNYEMTRNEVGHASQE